MSVYDLAVRKPGSSCSHGCGPSKDQQLEQAALDYAQTVSDKTPDATCEGFQGGALVDREGWEGIASTPLQPSPPTPVSTSSA